MATARLVNMVSRGPREPTKVDGVTAELVTVQGKAVRVIRAWAIATGRGWIEKTEQWAKEHGALLFDMESDCWGDWTYAVQEAIRHGYDIVVVRGFSVRD